MTKEERIFEIYKVLIRMRPLEDGLRLARDSVTLNRYFEMAVKDENERAAKDELRESNRAVWNELNLTVRTGNCLMAEDIYTLDELCKYTERDLLRIPNMGRKSVNEIREALALRGRVLGERA